MRVIAGRFKGRRLKGSHVSTTHPMSEKMRGAIFDILGPVNELAFADLYAGTGLIGIEALSRGASFVEFVEKREKAVRIINENVERVSVQDNVKITHTSVENWVDSSAVDKYNIVIADPPYDHANKDNLKSLLAGIHKRLKPHGIVILSHPGRTGVLDVDGAVVVKRRSFGNSALSFYRFEK